MNQLGTDIRKIIGIDDELAELKKMVSSAPIKGRVGQAYANGFSRGNANGNGTGKDKTESTDNKDANEKDKQNGNDTSKKADEELKKGDDLNMGLGGLFDCETKQCINVNFNQDYKRKPAGWDDQCKPPKQEDAEKSYWKVTKKTGVCQRPNGQITSTYTRSNKSLHSELSQYPPVAKYYNKNGTFNHSIVNRQFTLQEIFALNSIDEVMGKGEWCSLVSGDGWHEYGLTDHYSCTKVLCGQDNPSGTCQDTGQKVDRWPDSKCSEIQTNKLGTKFEMACKEFDKKMPKRFTEGSFMEMELCDKDGNKVKIKRTIKGFEITQDKYGTTSIVDPNAGKVSETNKWRR